MKPPLARNPDVVIRNATVFDGSGNEGVRADVAIQDDRVVRVGNVEARGGVELEAAGLAVAPGFIDVHTHDDFAVVLEPEMAFKVMGGVTTCVVGNCGFGPAPYDAASASVSVMALGRAIPEWEGFGGYLDYVASEPPSVNVGLLVGHGTVRTEVMPGAKRAPDTNELASMRAHVRAGLEAGALGLSTGLVYDPGRDAETAEIVALASELKGTGALYVTHMRNEGSGLLASIDEAIEIGERAGVPVQISHHKASGRENWGLVTESLARIEAARARGLEIHADQYPYTAASTALAAVLESAEWQPGSRALLDSVVIASTLHHPDWEGHTLAELALRLEVDEAKVGEHLVGAEPHATVIMHTMCEQDVCEVMRHPTTMIGSDGIPTLDGKPHPRLYGTFARVLGRYSREQGVLPMAEAIHRMTGFPARKFGLTDRGSVREGTFADLVVFDPETVIDRGTFEEPHVYPDGIPHVFVNGRQVVRDGVHVKARPGRPLRRH